MILQIDFTSTYFIRLTFATAEMEDKNHHYYHKNLIKNKTILRLLTKIPMVLLDDHRSRRGMSYN